MNNKHGSVIGVYGRGYCVLHERECARAEVIGHPSWLLDGEQEQVGSSHLVSQSSVV